MIDHGALAVELYEAERSTMPIGFLTERYPGLEWHDARKIARATDALRRREGDRLRPLPCARRPEEDDSHEELPAFSGVFPTNPS